MYDDDDSHVELSSESNYNWRVCCGGVPGLNNIQQGVKGTNYDVVLKLNEVTNSHVQLNDQSGYTYEVNISVDSGGINVTCYNTVFPVGCGSLGPGYVCVVRTDKVNDSHVSDCSDANFLNYVCCKVEIDATVPEFNIMEPSEISPWTNETSFLVEWESTDDGAVVCSNVLWSTSPTGPWDYITIGATTTSCPGNLGTGSLTFGDGEPVDLQSGWTYYFTGNATDDVGNTGGHIEPVNITVDWDDPELVFTIKDDQGRVIDSIAEPGANTIYINFTARDMISGVQQSVLYYTVTSPGGYENSYQASCGPSDSEEWLICIEAIPYNPETTITYYVNVTDKAGNNKRFPEGYIEGIITSHPLASFGQSYIYLTVGDTMLVPVNVLNINNVPDNIEVELDDTPPHNYPYARFEHICDPTDCTLSADGRNLTALNVDPFERRLYFVRIISGDKGDYTLQMNATSLIADETLEDSHILNIKIDYPVYFPGLEGWAILMMIMISAAYIMLSGEGRRIGRESI